MEISSVNNNQNGAGGDVSGSNNQESRISVLNAGENRGAEKGTIGSVNINYYFAANVGFRYVNDVAHVSNIPIDIRTFVRDSGLPPHIISEDFLENNPVIEVSLFETGIKFEKAGIKDQNLMLGVRTNITFEKFLSGLEYVPDTAINEYDYAQHDGELRGIGSALVYNSLNLYSGLEYFVRYSKISKSENYKYFGEYNVKFRDCVLERGYDTYNELNEIEEYKVAKIIDNGLSLGVGMVFEGSYNPCSIELTGTLHLRSVERLADAGQMNVSSKLPDWSVSVGWWGRLFNWGSDDRP